MKTAEQWTKDRDFLGGEYDTNERMQKLIEEVQSDAQNNPPPTTWEYRILQLNEPPGEDRLKEMGQQGWEMCGVIWNAPRKPGATAFFKRPNK